MRHRDPGDETSFELEPSPGFPFQGQRMVSEDEDRHPIPSAPVLKRHDSEISFQIKLASEDSRFGLTLAIQELENLLREYYRGGWVAAKLDSINRAMEPGD